MFPQRVGCTHPHISAVCHSKAGEPVKYGEAKATTQSLASGRHRQPTPLFTEYESPSLFFKSAPLSDHLG